MKKNTIYIMLIIILLFLTGILSYKIGRNKGLEEGENEKQYLQQLNRYSIEKMIVEDGPIYVIGHQNPDSDTVCSAIAFANLLNKLGYQAIPAITMQINKESEFILNEAGVQVPEELIDAANKNIFLVDHSEYGQTVEGMEDAHIVGILDHHGIGNVYTGHQVVYEAKPIGATATIIFLDYLNYGVTIDKTTAYILLGAILSDTNNLGASTSTKADAEAINKLAKIAEVENVDELFIKLHKESLSYEGMSDIDIFFSDYKEYETAGIKYGIALINAFDEEIADDLASRMKNIIAEADRQKDVDLIYASVGIREDGKKIDRIIPGNELSESIFRNAFPDYDEYNGTSFIFRKGLGRKTLFVPGLTEYLSAHPHE